MARNVIAELKAEKAPLREKIERLKLFMRGEKFREIGKNQQVLLSRQLQSMEAYYGCLVLRIDDLECDGQN